MSTDRELLELAAKAVGKKVLCTAAEMHGCEDNSTIYKGVMLVGVQNPWSPLTDDGDALRLAVKLGLQVVHYSVTSCGRDRVGVGVPGQIVKYDGDPYAATRRAIVRAAAAIGGAL